MPPSVNWLARAKEGIPHALVRTFENDLREAFSNSRTIMVSDQFSGYSRDLENKVILAVEVHHKEAYQTHIVKLGPTSVVGADYTGWQKCFSGHQFASRIFVPIEMRDVSRGRQHRAAVIYQNAFTLFGPDEETGRPETLETVVKWSIFDDKPDPTSVERVIRQVYGDLFHWFYRDAQPNDSKALAYFWKRLKYADKNRNGDLLRRWAEDVERVELRQDVLWLTHKGGDLTEDGRPSYEDPVDYVGWAREHKHIPQTLVGRSHGDIHGRNILVGVRRGEAEYAAAFDYGEMDDANVLAWDFVKLETELKVRFLLSLCGEHSKPANAAQESPTGKMEMRAIRAGQLAFALRFERKLAQLTGRLNDVSDPAALQPPCGRNITGDREYDRALGIVMRIRQEAALYLGDRQPQRGKRGLWQDEYYFALAVYGVSTAKFDYHGFESAFALVSAGVAVASMKMSSAKITDLLVQTSKMPIVPNSRSRYPYPSYRVPVILAHRLWRGRRTPARMRRAQELLEDAMKHYPHAVALRQEYALVLAETGQYERAKSLLEPLRELCAVFRDEETLARIGRLHKDVADIALKNDIVPIEELHGHPARQLYNSAYECYREAFEISEGYFSGINAATLALIVGKDVEAKTMAAQVTEACLPIPIESLTSDERYWVLVTEGEAYLVLGLGDKAVPFYRQALKFVSKDRQGMAQSTYNQVCRLRWALGEKAVRRVVALFKRLPFKLKPGPF